MSPAPRPEAVILDFGGVVFPIDIPGMFEAWSRASGRSAAELAGLVRGNPVHEAFERGEIPPGAFRDHVRRELELEIADDAFDRLWGTIYAEPWPEMPALLAALRRECRLVALTNTDVLHSAIWRELHAELVCHFERVFCSHDLGARKPEPGCFDAVLEALALAPERALFVDDHPENAEAARARGLDAFVSRSPADLAAGLRERGLLG